MTRRLRADLVRPALTLLAAGVVSTLVVAWTLALLVPYPHPGILPMPTSSFAWDPPPGLGFPARPNHEFDAWHVGVRWQHLMAMDESAVPPQYHSMMRKRAGFPFAAVTGEQWSVVTRTGGSFSRGVPTHRGAIRITRQNNRVDQRVIPLRPTFPGFLVNTLVFGAFIGLCWYGIRSTVREERRQKEQCPRCGYPGRPGATCPECGNVVPADWRPRSEAGTTGRERHASAVDWIIWLVFAALVLIWLALGP